SGNGTGRWQFWSAALDEWEHHPLVGRGAGSFETWWAQHGSITYFIRNAHSLYLETLGDTGLVGFLLLCGALFTGLAVAARRSLRAPPGMRSVLAGLTGTYVGFLVGAGVDWLWQLTLD